ncbi:MAG: DUF4384 domain-containing protein [Elusimicrobia bacterium]|nr:DUF4384 domain-containing protein [Elusimicrobiota bacterium]MDE2236531.1 DUF4384 domain-containing protein [Elusimicrobiota bacterium]MDE2426811.1 DUF4384 domain-containing protein [Elusimicrobiota bacterium]
MLRLFFVAGLCLLTAACGGRAALKPGQTAAPARKEEAAWPTAKDAGEPTMRRGRVLGSDPEGCTWLEGSATVVVSADMSLNQARAAAVEQARAAAVQDFLGVDVSSRFMDFEQEGLRGQAHLTESILRTTRNGRILKEKIVEEGYRDMPPVCRSCGYHVDLQACVLPRAADADKDFRVALNLSRNRLVSGDEATLTVSASRDCSIYLYDVYDLGRGDKTALIVPNQAVASKTLKAGQTWSYPDQDARARGVHLVAELPADDQVSAETIRLIATKAPLPAAVYDPSRGGYLGVLRRLHRLGIDWAEDAQAYTIYKK